MKKRIVGLDALKCLAIALIVIYHCFPDFLPGGFLAVEIFFVLSGFLIGAKLIRENKDPKKPKGLKGFFIFVWKRLLKFWPALLLCIILTLSLAFFADLDLLTGARENSLYAATFTTNIASILGGHSYEDSLIPNLFNHTWFLALEMQVCIIIYIVFEAFFATRKKETNYTKLAIFCTVISIASFGLMALYGWRFRLYDRAYFGPDTHIGAFFLGAGLAALISAKEKIIKPAKKRVFPWIVVGVSLLTIVAMTPFIKYSSAKAFVIALPATAIMTCVIIFAILKLQKEETPKWLMPFEYIGSISFYIYLFHWPLFILLKDLLENLAWIAPYATIFGSLVLAVVTDKIIMPFFKKSRVIKYAVLAAALVLPILSLIKAPNVSSIEESLAHNDEIAVNEEKAEEIAIDYTGIRELSTSLNDEIVPHFSGATDFAKKVVVANNSYSYGSGYVANYYRTGGSGARAAYNTPDLSANTLAALSKSSVMVIGDSVVWGAAKALAGKGFFVDAVGSRSMADAFNLLAGYRAANGGNLPYTIIISLVANYANVTASMLRSLMDTAGPGHRFVFVTGTCRQYSRESQNNAIKSVANGSSVLVADWAAISTENSVEYTGADGLHLTGAGRIAYANFIASVIGR